MTVSATADHRSHRSLDDAQLCDDLEAKLQKAEGTGAKLVDVAVAKMVAA